MRLSHSAPASGGGGGFTMATKTFTSSDGDGISVNGVVYILNKTDRKIGLFDLKDEKFLTPIPLHDAISVRQWHRFKLVEVEGNICLVSIPENVLDVRMIDSLGYRSHPSRSIRVSFW